MRAAEQVLHDAAPIAIQRDSRGDTAVAEPTRYALYMRALAEMMPGVQTLEVMHGQCSNPALSLDDAALFVTRTISYLETENEVRHPAFQELETYIAWLNTEKLVDTKFWQCWYKLPFLIMPCDRYQPHDRRA